MLTLIAAAEPDDWANRAACRTSDHMQHVRRAFRGDRLGVRWMSQAGYDPRSLMRVMEILEEAGGPNRQPEFFSTHPDPGNRIARIEEAIAAEFPNGVPEGMVP